MKKERHPLANALHSCHKNGNAKTKEKVRELVELMRRSCK